MTLSEVNTQASHDTDPNRVLVEQGWPTGGKSGTFCYAKEAIRCYGEISIRLYPRLDLSPSPSRRQTRELTTFSLVLNRDHVPVFLAYFACHMSDNSLHRHVDHRSSTV